MIYQDFYHLLEEERRICTAGHFLSILTTFKGLNRFISFLLRVHYMTTTLPIMPAISPTMMIISGHLLDALICWKAESPHESAEHNERANTCFSTARGFMLLAHVMILQSLQFFLMFVIYSYADGKGFFKVLYWVLKHTVKLMKGGHYGAQHDECHQQYQIYSCCIYDTIIAFFLVIIYTWNLCPHQHASFQH